MSERTSKAEAIPVLAVVIAVIGSVAAILAATLPPVIYSRYSTGTTPFPELLIDLVVAFCLIAATCGGVLGVVALARKTTRPALAGCAVGVASIVLGGAAIIGFSFLL